MKKLITLGIAAAFVGLLFIPLAKAQPVSDRAVIPVAVTLNQILRIHITDGGNVEFVFNSIDQYEVGINAGGLDPLYQTDFQVASSTRWECSLESESATLVGVDNPANTMAVGNVGYDLTESGVHNVGVELTDPSSAFAGVLAVTAAPVTIIGSAAAPTGNAGDVLDNIFTIRWRAGTTEPNMIATPFIDQDFASDRYVTNVFLDLTAL